MNTILFPTPDTLTRAVADRLRNAMESPERAPRALMLSGGQTPRAIYALLAQQPPPLDDGCHVLFSDERDVPDDSPDSNYGTTRPLLAAWGLPTARVLRPPPGLPLDEAAQLWHEQLTSYFDGGGTIPVGLLGLGADGHTASLFSLEDVASGGERYAVAVRRPAGPNRLSVTPALLQRVEHILFIASGPAKAGVVEQLQQRPESLPAGLAVAAAPSVTLYYCAGH